MMGGLQSRARDIAAYSKTLKALGSERSPGANVSGPLQVIVNFGTSLACSHSCDFCAWRRRWEELPTKVLVPTDRQLEEAIGGYGGFMASVSGGGDPLFGLSDRTLGELSRMAGVLHSSGMIAEVITREYGNVHRVLDVFDAFSLSDQGASQEAVDAAKAIRAAGKRVRVSMVLEDKPLDGDVDRAIEWLGFWGPLADRCDVKERYPCEKTGQHIRRRIMGATGNSNYIRAAACDELDYLIGGHVVRGLRSVLVETPSERFFKLLCRDTGRSVCVYGSASGAVGYKDVDIAYDSDRWPERKDVHEEVMLAARSAFGVSASRVRLKGTRRLQDFYSLQTLHGDCRARYIDGLRKSDGRRRVESGEEDGINASSLEEFPSMMYVASHLSKRGVPKMLAEWKRLKEAERDK
jgi:hypothetical protein